jgi:hypothetical protein
MAVTLHPDLELPSGDSWAVAGTLLDTNGSPLNLTAATLLEWCLIGPDGTQALGPRYCACGVLFTPTRANHLACNHRCSQRLRRDDRRLALDRAKRNRDVPVPR